MRASDVFVALWLSFAALWPLVWDKLPRASLFLRRIGLFHKWDMMLAPSREMVSSMLELRFSDGTCERRPLPATAIHGVYLATKVASDPSYASHVLGVAARGLAIDRAPEEVRLVLVFHHVPGMERGGAVRLSERVFARARVA